MNDDDEDPDDGIYEPAPFTPVEDVIEPDPFVGDVGGNVLPYVEVDPDE